MAKPLRIEYPDAWYHVMNRERRGEQVFESKEDYSFAASQGESLKTIGTQLAIDNYSTVSTVIERFKARRQSDRSLAHRVARVRQIIMSQEQT